MGLANPNPLVCPLTLVDLTTTLKSLGCLKAMSDMVSERKMILFFELSPSSKSTGWPIKLSGKLAVLISPFKYASQVYPPTCVW